MVVGGSATGFIDTVELVSLDPDNHPIPECLKSLGPFPVINSHASGAELQGLGALVYILMVLKSCLW